MDTHSQTEGAQTAVHSAFPLMPIVRESNIETYFIRKVREHGGDVRKVKWPGRRHAPDRLALFDGYHFLVELKRPKKGCEGGQLREHDRLRRAGFEVYVASTKGEVDAIIERCIPCRNSPPGPRKS